jgi:hypothetical protein
MRLLPSDPDVETIVSRIEAEDLNLQPDFQRGEVWSKVKKQRLVDSILRDWHVPPIHVIELIATRRQEVLDGQQRLVAIRDFYRNEFAIDGTIEPKDPKIARLDGVKYRDLPDDVRRQFNQFTIRIFRIVDYKSSEPAELFFRLNQPTNLTSAEQRNAYFGPVREQVKALVDSLPDYGLQKEFLGFSNSRMAYDDVLCRVALSVERGSIAEKISSSDLVALYRDDSPLSHGTDAKLRTALEVLGEASRFEKLHPRFNKATLYSWIVFLVRNINGRVVHPIAADDLAEFLAFFEDQRLLGSLGLGATKKEVAGLDLEWLFQTYDDRATSRVADVSSVILRDVVIWLSYEAYRQGVDRPLAIEQMPEPLRGLAQSRPGVEADVLAKTAIERGWGKLV